MSKWEVRMEKNMLGAAVHLIPRLVDLGTHS